VLTGVVLAGGESRRFGSNKALLEFGGKVLLEHCVDSLRRHCDPILVIANNLRLYYAIRAHLIKDLTPHQGPLGGIYTALLFSPNDWAFVKATDMPYLVPTLLDRLVQARERADVVVPMVEDRYEPLLALYHRRCLPAIAAVLEGTKRNIVEFYHRVKVRPLEEKDWRAVDPEGRSFWNVNTPADWERLIQI
jgi:molybdenum cofactor guanylyltransferase